MGWMDIARIIEDDDSGGGMAPDFFTRSYQRRKASPSVADPLKYAGADFGSEETPVTSMQQTWRPPNSRSNRYEFSDEPGPATKDYLKHIQSAPTHEQYSPSIWHRLSAGLVGGVTGGQQGAAAGYKTAQGVLETPYQRAVQDYELKGQGLEAAAKIEEATNRTRQAYQKAAWDQEEADKDREVKWANSEINRIKAEQAAKRIALEAEAKKATNQVAVDRLNAEINKWDNQYNTELAKLELVKQGLGIRQQQANTGQYNAATNRMGTESRIATGEQNAETNARRADAYTGYMGRLGQPKAPTQASIGIGRRIIEEEIKNENPKILDKQGAVKPEYAPEFERQIQERLRRRGLITGTVSEPDADRYEVIP
jgi:hypothetical protein